MKKVGLALSGGGAYGFAHIGVLQVLEENKIPVSVITGTSMGALIGGAYAAGVSIEKMIEITDKFKRSSFMDINPFLIVNPGLLTGNKVIRLLRTIIGNVNIEDCKTKFCAVACDLKTSNKVSINSGDIVDAIRASISVPCIFAPVRKNGMVLIDGGSADNMPVEDAREMGADVVIASDVCTYYTPQNNLRNVIDVMMSASNAMIANQVKYKKDKGDIYLKIDQPTVTQFKFTPEEIKTSINNGRLVAEAMLPKIKEILGLKWLNC